MTASTTAGNSTAVTPTVPDGTVGDEILWAVPWGHSAATDISSRPTLSGGLAGIAQHIGSVWGGGGTYGASTGPRGLSYWHAIASSATGSVDETTFSLPSAGVIGGLAIRISKAAGTRVDYAFTSGIDTNAGDTWNPVGYTNVNATANDLLIHAMAAVPSASNPVAILAWPGTTLGTESNVDTINITPGDDVRFNVRSRSVSSGTSSGAPTTPASTTGMTGVHGILRLREVTPGTILQWSGDGLSPGTLTTSSAGTGDTPPDQITSSGATATIEAIGIRAPRLRLEEAALGSFIFIDWDFTTTPTAAFRGYFTPNGTLAINHTIVSLRDAGEQRIADVNITGTGSLRVYDAANTNVVTSADGVIVDGTTYRIELIIDCLAQTMGIKLFEGEGLTPTVTLTNSTGSYATSVGNLRVGKNTTTAKAEVQYWDDLLVTNIASYPGPVPLSYVPFPWTYGG